jgi:hypothetical protein
MRNRVVAGDDDVECAVDGIEIAEIGDSESNILTEPEQPHLVRARPPAR